jgi:hypothetical protein
MTKKQYLTICNVMWNYGKNDEHENTTKILAYKLWEKYK